MNTIVLRTPDSCVASIPSVMGFHPENSVVILWLGSGSLIVTQRIDIEALATPGVIVDDLLDKANPDEAIVLLYADSYRQPELDGLLSVLARSGIAVRDVLHVFGERWTSAMCSDSSCCPPEGKVIDWSLSAEFVAVGAAPMDKRSDLEAQFVPSGEKKLKQNPLGDEWRDAAIDKALKFYMTGKGNPVTVCGYLDDIIVRDTVLWEVLRASASQTGVVNPEVMRGCAENAAALCRANVPSAPAATIAGLFYYAMGDGARGNICANNALSIDENYSLADLLRMSLTAAFPPAEWIAAMNSLTREIVRQKSEEKETVDA